MKKIIIGSVSLLAASLAVTAQQLPNVGFSEWKTTCGSSEQVSSGMRERPGIEPEGWNGSSINQKVGLSVTKELVFKGEDSSLPNSPYVSLKTQFVGMFSMGSNAPGFLNFGTPWVYAVTNVSKCDGGVYGGIQFTYRPDFLVLDIKRVDSNDEESHIIAYTWKGTFKSKIGEAGSPNESKENVDRAVLGQITPDDGSDGTLIASLEKKFKSTSGWENMTLPFEYKDDSNPENINVIICCGDYWNRGNLKTNTEVLVDNVKLVYCSRLESLTVGGVAVDGFSADKFSYELPVTMPEADAIQYTLAGPSKSAKVETTFDKAANTCTLTVSNVGEDIDGLKEHSYVLAFAAPVEKINGYLNIMYDNHYMSEPNTPATIEITQKGNGKADFCLPDFTMSMGGTAMNMGDIILKDVDVTTEGDKQIYVGKSDNLNLMDGAIEASATISGTIIGDKAAFDINVIWDNDGENVPISVTFTTDQQYVREVKEYDGFLNIKLMDQAIGDANSAASIEVIQIAETKCIFRLRDFSLDLGTGPMPLGDIVVEDVTLTTANGVTTYVGHVDGMELLDGAIVADVDLNGTITDDDNVDMNIAVNWDNDGEIVPIAVTFTSDKIIPSAEPQIYNGYLNISMMGATIGEPNTQAQVEVIPTGDDECTFRLPNFSLDLGDGPASLGDIEIRNVKISTKGDDTVYTGHVDGMELLDGAIVADVDLNGTIAADGKIDMNISVNWKNDNDVIPIVVKFTSYEIEASISAIEADADGVDEWFTISGVKVRGNLPAGIYLRRQGNVVEKVIIR